MFSPAPGKEPIAGYRLVHFIGAGGFGEVWQATGPGGTNLALKFVKADTAIQAMEARALELMTRIRHPNLIALFGSWPIDGHLVIGMELADQTLRDRFKEATENGLAGIPVNELVVYFQEAAKGIDYLNRFQHSHPRQPGKQVSFQHRDIKPANLLLLGGGTKVGDWGLIRMLQQTTTGHSGPMTPAYAPPEFFLHKTSNRSDQYSLAVSYHYLRTGRLPYTNMEADPQARRVDLHEMLAPTERQALEKALAASPRNRYPNCHSFVDALGVAPALTFISRATVLAEGTPDKIPTKTLPKPRRRGAQHVLSAPDFHHGGVVPHEFFIGREAELTHAERLLSGCHSFLIVGNRRVGKTSFCNKLIHDLRARPANKLLATHLDLQFCERLTVETFLEHTIINMIGEIARSVFRIKYDDLFRVDPTEAHPELKQDHQFDSFVNIYRLVTRRTHQQANVLPSPLRSHEFVQFQRALRDIVRAKGWNNFVVIFDEANRLPTEFPVDLLISSEQALAQSGVTTVYVASPEIVESFQPLRESFSRELFLGPFPGVDDMRRLLARYYFDDATRVNSLPVADEASQRLWHLSNGVPYIIQLLAECSFRIGREKGARTLKAVHVTAAYEELKAERKLTYFGTAGDET